MFTEIRTVHPSEEHKWPFWHKDGNWWGYCSYHEWQTQQLGGYAGIDWVVAFFSYLRFGLLTILKLRIPKVK